MSSLPAERPSPREKSAQPAKDDPAIFEDETRPFDVRHECRSWADAQLATQIRGNNQTPPVADRQGVVLVAAGAIGKVCRRSAKTARDPSRAFQGAK